MEQYIIWATIIIYVVILVIIGIIAQKSAKSVSDLTVGGRNAGAWLSALSYGTAYFSAVMFVGYAGGTGWKFGLWGVAAGLGNAVFGSWLAWKVLARKTRDISHKHNIQTMPGYFEKRYKSPGMKTLAAVITFFFLIPYSASVYNGFASICEVLLKIDVLYCKIIIVAATMLLLFLGGYAAQMKADFFQGIVMMFGVSLLIVFVVRSQAVGGISGIVEYAQNNLTVTNGALSETVQGLPSLNFSEAIGLISLVLMTSFGTWGLPHTIQKYYGIKSDAQAKKGTIISTVFAVLVAGGGYFIGSLGKMYFLPNDERLQNASGQFNQDYIVPNILKESALPDILLGIVIVLLLAASISTLCSITLSASSTLSLDLIKANSKKGISDRNTAVMTKVLCVLFALLSFIVAGTNTPILDMMSYSWGILSGAFLAPYALSLYIKQMNKAGGFSGMLGGFMVGAVPAFCKISLIIMGNPKADSGAVYHFNNLAAQGPLFACIAIVFSIVLCLAVSCAVNSIKGKPDNEYFYA